MSGRLCTVLASAAYLALKLDRCSNLAWLSEMASFSHFSWCGHGARRSLSPQVDSSQVRTSEWCMRGYAICTYTLSCPADYELECQSLGCEASEKVCTDIGAHFRPAEWNGHCEDWPGDVDTRYECCECVGSEPVPEITAPTTSGSVCQESDADCASSLNSNCCKDELSCPEGYELSSAVPLCGVTHCDQLGPAYAASEIIYRSDLCRRQYLDVYPEDRTLCKTCEKMAPGGASTQEPSSTSTPAPTAAVWEHVGDPGKSACRGMNSNDNNDTYYEVHDGITELEACQSKCVEQLPSCKGIEFSYGRCEIWTRPHGIFAWAELNISEFTCMRFGWPTQRLLPVDGGFGRACRGDFPTENSQSFYDVVVAETLEECKAACSAALVCYGIEFSLGRCEIWKRHVGASIALANFTCLAYQEHGHGSMEAVDQPSIVLP
ncbi:hypothetical protein AK812_SmicGene21776 [Symbiodinium microadriaticum]|uniref:Apple domain-containing protein n=1 Tax=Symbiodinium microadriaticum TaxID=2951 RepID=A0A1Q9DLH6_SYMMI|nr:hypothetical protein AK812_SmicGene21776 [Symbiodinium microadriaticum]